MKEYRSIKCNENGILNIGSRVIRTLIDIVKNHISLIITELDEGKVYLLQILMLIGLTLLLVTFSLTSLLLVMIWLINPQYRLVVMITITGILFLLALSSSIWTLYKIKNLQLFTSTCKILKNDSKFFKND
ncbi:MAG: phage holin family protein [Candidatus Dasytiphilus stammeri]